MFLSMVFTQVDINPLKILIIWVFIINSRNIFEILNTRYLPSK